MKKKLALIILDGFGINTKNLEENGIYCANNQTFTNLFQQKFAQLQASWEAVGLPAWQMGNSEVGHITLWTGRIVEQSFVSINKLLDNHIFEEQKGFQNLLEHCKQNHSNLHLIQIFGNGGVHSIDEHLLKLLPLIPITQKTYLHFFWDGRDLPPQSALELMKKFESWLENYPHVHIASFWGRYFGMDRDNNRDRVQKAYDAIAFQKNICETSVSEYLQKCYTESQGDEFIPPMSFAKGEPIEKNDGVFFVNFRTDRARQFTQALKVSRNPEEAKKYAKWDPNFSIKPLDNLYILTMTKYYPEYDWPTILPEKNIQNTLSEVLSKNNINQLHLAETEKFAHVTKFFNAENTTVYSGQENVLVASHKVATYDLDPAMSAEEIFNVFKTRHSEFDVFIINYANGDMVGHTGNMEAVKKAINTLGTFIQKTLEISKEAHIDILLTADHGNSEEMGTPEAPKTAHTTNLVPCRYIKDGEVQNNIKDYGELSDIAPTMLKILGIPVPQEMTGTSLLIQ